MKTSMIGAGVGLLLAPSVPVLAQASHPSSTAGEAYVITQSYKTSEEASDGASGSSSGSDTLVERVIARRRGGVELEYDLPIDSTPDDRARTWQLPARVLRMDGARMQLLNSTQLEDRLAVWLKAANWDRSVCGRLIFTWNAFRIECDPQSIIRRLEEIDLSSQDLRDGASYLDARTGGAGRLVRKNCSSKGTIFSATIEVDPDKVRLERAETDVAVGELIQKVTSLETALRERSQEQVSGSISVVWETDDAGGARKRTKTTALETKRPDGTVEKRITIEVVERRRVHE
jgi:hypothetical protein